jgi:hypothetical protein
MKKKICEIKTIEDDENLQRKQRRKRDPEREEKCLQNNHKHALQTRKAARPQQQKTNTLQYLPTYLPPYLPTYLTTY